MPTTEFAFSENQFGKITGKTSLPRHLPTLLSPTASDTCVWPTYPNIHLPQIPSFELTCRIGFSPELSFEGCAFFFHSRTGVALPKEYRYLSVPVVAVSGQMKEVSRALPGFGVPPPLPPPHPPTSAPPASPAGEVGAPAWTYSSVPEIRLAEELVFPPALINGSRHKRSLLIKKYEKNSRTAYRYMQDLKVIKRGSSIGTSGGVDRGTVCCLVKSAGTMGIIRALTCAHVAAFYPIPGDPSILYSSTDEYALRTIVAPGNFDIIQELYRVLKSPLSTARKVTEIKEVLSIHNRFAGTAVCRKLGVDSSGFRQDWALLEFDNSFQVDARTCCNEDHVLGLVEAGSGGSVNLVGMTDPVRGDSRKFLQDGSTTGFTSGFFFTDQARQFLRNTKFGLDDALEVEKSNPIQELHPDNIQKGQVLVFEIEVESGDSGGSVITSAEDGLGFDLAAMALAMFVWDERTFLFAVSSSVVFRQISEETGEIYNLAE